MSAQPSSLFARLDALARRWGRSAAEWLTGRSMTAGVSSFFKSLGLVGLWFGIARVFTMITGILAARLLGSAGFGDVSLSVTVAQVFTTFAVFGLNAAVARYAAASGESHGFTAAGIYSVLGLTVVTLLIMVLGYGYLAPLLEAPGALYWMGLGIGVPMTISTIFFATQQGTGRYAQRGKAEALLALGTLAGFGLGLLLYGRNFRAGAMAYIVGYFVTMLATAFWLRGQYRLQDLSLAPLKAMAPYAWYNFLCGVGFLFTAAIQRPIIKNHFSSNDVGQYQLYSTASLNLVVFAGTMLTTVFFPTAAKSRDRSGLWSTTWKAWLKVVGILWLILAAAQIIIVLAAGKSEFALDLSLVALFATCSCVLMVQSTMGQILGVEGVRGAKLGVQMSLFVGLGNFALSLLLIPSYGVHGAILSLLAVYSGALLWLHLVKHKYT